MAMIPQVSPQTQTLQPVSPSPLLARNRRMAMSDAEIQQVISPAPKPLPTPPIKKELGNKLVLKSEAEYLRLLEMAEK